MVVFTQKERRVLAWTLRFVGVVLLFGAIAMAPAIADEPPPLPQWVSATVGSYPHPLGVASLYARCPWAGVFSESDGWSTFAEGADLLNDQTMERLRAAVAFFNRVADRNDFYRSSRGLDIDWSIIRPAEHYIQAMAPTWPRRDAYESTQQFASRQQAWRASHGGNISVVVRSEKVFGPSGLPKIGPINSTVKYDPDNQRFVLGNTGMGKFERLERLVRYDSRTDTETFEDAVIQLGTNSPPASFLETVAFHAPHEVARRLHPYLAVVATGEVRDLDNLDVRMILGVDSLEIRNVCTNEVLAKERLPRVPR